MELNSDLVLQLMDGNNSKVDGMDDDEELPSRMPYNHVAKKAPPISPYHKNKIIDRYFQVWKICSMFIVK